MSEKKQGALNAFKQGFAKRKKFFKGLIIGFILGVAAVTVAAAGYMMADRAPAEEPQEETQPDTVIMLSQIVQISELATAEQSYTICQKVSDSNRLFDKIDIPFTENWFILAYNATLKAGVDLEKATIRVEDSTVYIGLPQAEIISNEIHTDTFTVLHESNNIIHPIKVEDVTSYIDKSRCEAEAASIEGDLLKEAETNAYESIRALLTASLPQGYTVAFEPLPSNAE